MGRPVDPDVYDRKHSASSGSERGSGAVSVAGLGAWIDAFERDELFDAVDGKRDKLRVADTAIRALSRYLVRALG